MDSSNMPVVALEISGNDEQEERSGKNIFKPFGAKTITANEVAITINEDNTITLNGTCTKECWIEILYNFHDGSSAQTEKIIDLDPAKKYTFSLQKISGKVNNMHVNATFQLNAEGYGLGGATISTNSDGTSKTTQGTEGYDGIYRTYLYIPQGAIFADLVFGVQVEEGETMTEYEPYGAMPSPLYLSEVETVNTQANIIICSNNLYDNKDMMNFDCKYEEDDYIKCEYDNTSGTSTIFKNFFTNDSKLIKPDKVYWVILEVKEVKGTGKIQLLYDSANIQLSGWQDWNFSNLTTGKIIVKKVTSNANSNNASMLLRSYCQFAVGESGSITFRLSISPVEVTAENFKYVPFAKQLKTVDIQQPMLEGDYFVKEEDGWKEVHTRNKKMLHELDSWSNQYGTHLFNVQSVLTDLDKASRIGLCNYFKYNSVQQYIDSNLADGEFAIQVGPAAIFFKDERFDNVTDWKDWLAQKNTEGNPLYIWYKLATPLKLACTEKQIEQLDDLLNTSTYKNITHIYSTDKVSPVIKVVYKKDLDTILNNQKNDYDTRLSNIEKLLTTTTSAMLLDNLQTDLEKEVI